jgi:hypothetical protein
VALYALDIFDDVREAIGRIVLKRHVVDPGRYWPASARAEPAR